MPADRPTKIIVVDDDLRDVQPIEAAASALGFKIQLVEARESQDETVDTVVDAIGESAPVVVIDYRLDVPANVHYRGGSVAAGLKDRLPTVPLVLLTSDANMHSLLVNRPLAKSFFDWSVLKDEFSAPGHATDVVRRLDGIARGFALITSKLSGGQVSEELLIELTGAAHRDLDGSDSWFVRDILSPSAGEVARWVLGKFVNVVSPLVSKAEGAAELGMTVNGFEQLGGNVLVGSRYSGVFNEVVERYWRSDIEEQRLPLATLEADQNRAGCTWCDRPVDRSCSVCDLGCDIAHALPAARQLGTWGLPTIVCFLCVAQGRAGAGQTDLDPDVADIVDLLITGQLVATP